jgi:type I restriction enzyme S subunit
MEVSTKADSSGSGARAKQTPPLGWRHVRLTDVARLESGHTPSKRNPEYWGGNIPWVSLFDTEGLDTWEIQTTSQTITEAGLANSSARLLPKGTVVFSRTATVGKATVMGSSMATSLDFACYVCGPEVHNFYLSLLLRSMRAEWKKLMAGSIHNTVYMPVFKTLSVDLPPHDEQVAVAETLLDVERHMDSLEQLLTKKRQIKQGAMQELLTGKRRLPGFSGKWKSTPLSEVSVFLKGQGLSKAALSSDGLIPCIHYGQLFTEYGPVIDAVKSFVNEPHSGPMSLSNDVLMPTSDVTPTGLAKASCVLQDGVVLGGDILVIRSHPDLLYGPFLSNVIRSMPEKVLELVTGSTVFHLYARDMAGYRLDLPNVEEQEAIVQILSDMDTDIAALETRLTKARALKQAIAQALLTGRIRLVKPAA